MPRAKGCFIAVVGASGVGKDTLISKAAEFYAGNPQVHFARRVVTRVADVSLEDHDSCSEEEFEKAAEAGAFSLGWEAHGLKYGLRRNLLELAEHSTVIANISRAAIEPATRIFGRVGLVEITAAPSVRFERLCRRGRESEADIRARVERKVAYSPPAGLAFTLAIDNSGELNDALREFCRAIDKQVINASL